MGKHLIPFPEEAVDWLWYKPDPDVYLETGLRMWHCWKCDVTWRQLWSPNEGARMKCWCCGQFQKLPKI